MTFRKKLGRILIGLLILIIVSITFLVINLSQQYKKLEAGTYTLLSTTDTIPFTYSSSGHILIDVKIDNSDQTYPFILDCGASNYIFKDRFKDKDFKGNGFGVGIGAMGNIFATRIKQLDTLIIGSAHFYNLNAKEIDFNFSCSDDIYGLVGAGIMRHLDWRIDFEKSMIVVSDQLDKLQVKESAIRIPLDHNEFSHHLNTHISFGENKPWHNVLVDIGNNGTLFMKENLIVKDSLGANSINVIGETLGGLGKAEKEQQNEKIYCVDSLFFNNSEYQINKVPINTSPNGLSLLGIGFFKHYRTTISWKSEMLFLEPYKKTQNFVWKSFGVTMDYDENEKIVKISNIIETSIADRMGVPLNAEVISVNGIRLDKKNSLCEFESFADSNGFMDLLIMCNGEERRFHMERQDLF